MKHTLLAIAAGIVSGMLALASLSGASIAIFYLSLVHPLPLFYAGQSLGVRAAMIASATAVSILSLASLQMGLVFGLLYAVPVWVMIRLCLIGPNGMVWQIAEDQPPHTPEGPNTRSTFADRITGRGVDWGSQEGQPPRDIGWFPAGSILAVVAAVASAYIVALSVMTGGGLEDKVTEALTELSNAFAAPQGETVLQQAVLTLVPYFAGMAAGMWALGLVLNMVIAQGLLAKGGRNIRPTPRLRELTLPDWLSWALVGAALVALIAPGEMEYLGRNIAIVLAVPFFFLGLAVVHKLAAQTPFPGAMLGLMYLVVIFSGWFVLVIAAIGILEQWIGLKKRIKPSA
ncbi:DUF2232 domain-containing protein [Magnetovibrio sp.]|uniref:DUF2232 domain-containing protein n=1 Tax=Magnetovibrio sp. TaxID=2024836 RepID=UPI002F948F46